MVDMVFYDDGKWMEDPILEMVCKDNLDESRCISSVNDILNGGER